MECSLALWEPGPSPRSEAWRGPYDVTGDRANNDPKSMNNWPIPNSWRNTRTGVPALVVLTLMGAAGCQAPFAAIDQSTTALLAETNQGLGADTVTPRLDWAMGSKPDKFRDEPLHDYTPPTANPAAAELRFTADGDAESVMRRLEAYATVPADAISMNLVDTLVYAVANSREYRFAEEDYLLEALRLISERHLWGPRLFNDTSVDILAIGDDGLYDSSVRLVNDLRVTQRLPYGGEISASLLASATRDLHEHVAGENTQSLDLLFSLDIPLLRGAGWVAREPLLQAERNVVYAARAFERFRRQFAVDITTDFLQLVVQQRTITNTLANVEMLEGIEERERALAEAGRTPPFEAAQAAQATLGRRDGLNDQQEFYRLNLDRFKVRIGMPEEQPVNIVASSPGLPIPRIELNDAVRAAMSYRLDLQNRRDFIDDARRGVNNARNDLLADLDLAASAVPTGIFDDSTGVNFDLQDTTYRASIVLGLPIDRTIERSNLRQSQVDLQRSVRDYERFRDTVAVEVRAAVRNIDRALFSQELQQENLRVSHLRVAQIDAAPDRADARDRTEAATGLLGAQDAYLQARRDLQIAILLYLLESGQLRLGADGTIRPLNGMELREQELDFGLDGTDPNGPAP